jgi:hypothetical protein
MNKTACFLVLIALFSSFEADARDIYAKSVSVPDVQAAIDSATDMDVVILPEDTAVWASAVSITNKGITLKGQGDKTLISDTLDDYTRKMVITGQEGKPFRITGITFTTDTNASQPPGYIVVLGTCKNWRIDHCTFVNQVRCIWVGAKGEAHFTNGLIDHCTFLFGKQWGGMTHVAIHCFRDAPWPEAGSWNRPLTLGTSNAVFVEDCFIDFAPFSGNQVALNPYYGARYAFRFNRSDAFIEASGTCYNSRGCVSAEVYHNTFEHDMAWSAIGIHGGTGVVFHNSFPAFTQNTPMCIGHRRSHNSTCSSNHCRPEELEARCDGTNPLDGNLPGMMGYPCLDQAGRGPGTEIVNGITVQKSEPVYEWNNYKYPVNDPNDKRDANFRIHGDHPQCTNPSLLDHVQEGRDFHKNMSRPDYVPYPYPHPLTNQPELALNLVVESASTSQVILSWSNVTGAANYGVSRDWQANVSVAGTEYADNDPGYIYVVKAYDNTGKIQAMEGVLASTTSIKKIRVQSTVFTFSIMNQGVFYQTQLRDRVQKVKIMNLSGKLIKDIPVNGGSITWNGKDISGRYISSGILIAQIVSKKETANLKFVLIKH